jgi:hypothetical protein
MSCEHNRPDDDGADDACDDTVGGSRRTLVGIVLGGAGAKPVGEKGILDVQRDDEGPEYECTHGEHHETAGRQLGVQDLDGVGVEEASWRGRHVRLGGR